MASRKKSGHPEILKVPLLVSAAEEGGFVVTSPLLPELHTDGETLEQAVDNARDAIVAVIELYEDLKKPLPPNLRQDPRSSTVWFDHILVRP